MAHTPGPATLDRVMSELVAVSRSAASKREEAANLSRIWAYADLHDRDGVDVALDLAWLRDRCGRRSA